MARNTSIAITIALLVILLFSSFHREVKAAETPEVASPESLSIGSRVYNYLSSWGSYLSSWVPSYSASPAPPDEDIMDSQKPMPASGPFPNLFHQLSEISNKDKEADSELTDSLINEFVIIDPIDGLTKQQDLVAKEYDNMTMKLTESEDDEQLERELREIAEMSHDNAVIVQPKTQSEEELDLLEKELDDDMKFTQSEEAHFDEIEHSHEEFMRKFLPKYRGAMEAGRTALTATVQVRA